MATAEKLRAAAKLLSRLSERKKSIIEHVKQQTESYSQHLASKLLIKGIETPPWLLDPCASGSKEINEEVLISKLLSQYPQPSACWSVPRYPGHGNLVSSLDHKKYGKGNYLENAAPNNDIDRTNDSAAPRFNFDHGECVEDHGECVLNTVPEQDIRVALPEDQTNNDSAAPRLNVEDHGECALHMVPELDIRVALTQDQTDEGILGVEDHGECALNTVPRLDVSAASPEGQTDERIPDVYSMPDQSLVRIQRSRSRQKALELRSSAKAPSKSGSRHDSISDVVSSQIRFSLSIANQSGQNGELSQLVEPCKIGTQSCENGNVVGAHCLSREMGMIGSSKRIIRSETQTESPNSAIGSFPLGCSSDDSKGNASSNNARERSKEFMPISETQHVGNYINKSPKSAGPSAVCRESFRDRGEEEANFLCKDDEKNVYSGKFTTSVVSSRRQDWRCLSTKADVHLDHKEFGHNYPLDADFGLNFQYLSSSSDDYKDVLDGMTYSSSLAYSSEKYGWDSRNQPPSPVGKLWSQLSSHTGSSGKCSISNPELTCFPIEEDPSSSEENATMEENAGDTLDETDSWLANQCDERQPLKYLTNMGMSPPMSIAAEEETLRANSMEFLKSKFSVTATQEKALLGPKHQSRKKSESSDKQTSCTRAAYGRNHQLSTIGPNAMKRSKESVTNSISKPIVSNKTSLKGQDQKLSLRGSRQNNIVSNGSSFIPLVQQKQAVTTCKGKVNVKVKALKAAEAAKREEEKKANERKQRKEALKLERALKLEENNLKQMELEKKKREEVRKKKDADIIAKKRLREEEEKEKKEKKRMRLESRPRQREQEEKKCVERSEIENQRTKDDQMNSEKEHSESKIPQNRESTRGEGVCLQKTDANLTLNELVVNHEECGFSSISCDAEAIHAVDRSPLNEDLIVQTNHEKSYEISLYQSSDDEDEEDDELPTKKYIPSWASKSSIARLLPLQLKLNHDVIFPLNSFCRIDKVLLPRKLQQK